MIDWIAAHQAILIGVIFMLVLGPAVGNYACSVVYRLPLGRTPFERHPYCGHCDTDLKPVDLFPILSWFSTNGHCRYCGCLIPALYTVIELACAAIFIGYFLKFGISEQFLLLTVYGVFAIILASIQWQQGWVSSSIYAYTLFAIALLRTLEDDMIYGWVQGGFLMLMLALAWQRLVTLATGTEFRPFDTPWIWWMVLLGSLVPQPQWALLIVPAFLLVVFRFAAPSLQRWVLAPVSVVALYLPILIF